MNCSSVRNRPTPSAPDFDMRQVDQQAGVDREADRCRRLVTGSMARAPGSAAGAWRGNGPSRHRPPRHRGRPEMDLPRFAVDDDPVAVLAQRHHGGGLADDRDAHGAGDDHHMARHRRLLPAPARGHWHADSRAVRPPHVARHDDRIAGKPSAGRPAAIARQLPEQPVRQIVEIMHAVRGDRDRSAVIRARCRSALSRPPLPPSGRCGSPLELAHPALVMREHAIGFEHFAVLALHRDVATRQHVVDRDRSERWPRPAAGFPARILGRSGW